MLISVLFMLVHTNRAVLPYEHLGAIFCDIRHDVYGLELVFLRLHHQLHALSVHRLRDQTHEFDSILVPY